MDTNDNRVNLIWYSSASNANSRVFVKDSENVVRVEYFFRYARPNLMATFKIKWKSGDIQLKVNGVERL